MFFWCNYVYVFAENVFHYDFLFGSLRTRNTAMVNNGTFGISHASKGEGKESVK